MMELELRSSLTDNVSLRTKSFNRGLWFRCASRLGFWGLGKEIFLSDRNSAGNRQQRCTRDACMPFTSLSPRPILLVLKLRRRDFPRSWASRWLILVCWPLFFINTIHAISAICTVDGISDDIVVPTVAIFCALELILRLISPIVDLLPVLDVCQNVENILVRKL
jgi:hypothetical protein